MKWFLKALNDYATFRGRARRKEYWYFVLFNILFGIVAMIIDRMLGLSYGLYGYGPIYGLYSLALIIPSLAVSVRRLHDVGRSGWMLLVALIPLIGFFWLLFLFVTEGDAGTNDFGPNPIISEVY